MNPRLVLLVSSILLFCPVVIPASEPALTRPIVSPAAGQPFFIALSVPDIEASAKWYREMFGLSVERDMKVPDNSVHIVILRSSKLMIELIQHRDSHPPSTQLDKEYLAQGFTKVGFFVENIESVVNKLKAKGVSFAYDLIEDRGTNVKFVMIRDNSGNLVQLFEPLRANKSR